MDIRKLNLVNQSNVFYEVYVSKKVLLINLNVCKMGKISALNNKQHKTINYYLFNFNLLFIKC